jgi:hypothetical protein
MANVTQEMSPDYDNRYSYPVYDCSGNDLEGLLPKEELELFNPDLETLQQHHDFLVALWEARVIYVGEIADYQIAMRRESCGQVLPFDRSPFRDMARGKAQQRVNDQRILIQQTTV